MSDLDLRQAEKAAKEGDVEARRTLTAERLRCGVGQVIFWPGSMPPFDCAVRTRLEGASARSENPRTVRDGWSLAVVDLDDLVRLETLGRTNRRSGSLVDLATGNVVQVFGGRTTEGRFGPLHGAPQVDGEGPAGPFLRKSSEPLYDREGLPEAWRGPLAFFQNTRSYAYHTEEFQKSPSDCNLLGNGGCLPRGYRFTVTGLSLIADETFDERDLDRVRDGSSVRILHGNFYLIASCPTRLALAEPTRRTKDGVVLRTALPPMVLPFDEPFVIEEIEHFRVELSPGFAIHLENWRDAKIMCVLHGTMERPRYV